MTWEHKGDAGTSKISGVTWKDILDQRSLQSIGGAINSVLGPSRTNFFCSKNVSIDPPRCVPSLESLVQV